MLTAAKRPVPEQTRQRQRQASDPDMSVWVAANAGSGKTHVLAQRVVRLLLKGVAPSRILCLTYTKAAAANMAKRVFDMLAAWATMEDSELRAAIERDWRGRRRSEEAALRAPPVRAHGGDAGRAEGADDPRFLRAAAASVSIRGECRRRFPCRRGCRAGGASQHRAPARAQRTRSAITTGLARRCAASPPRHGPAGFQDLLRELLNRRALIAPWLPVEMTRSRGSAAQRAFVVGGMKRKPISRAPWSKTASHPRNGARSQRR